WMERRAPVAGTEAPGDSFRGPDLGERSERSPAYQGRDRAPGAEEGKIMNTTRRDFLQRAGAGAIVYKMAGARPQLKAASKNDQIGLGFIGVGIRGTFLLQ